MKHFYAALSLIVLALPVQADDVDAGRDLYQNHCATCHGIEATGQGPMRPVLTVQPVDLTRLSVNNGGDFPLTAGQKTVR